MRRTTGLTYAEYVHQGFGQLTFATAADVPGRLGRRAARPRPRPRRPAPGCGSRSALLCVLTLVVVASALHRMDLYQDAYGFTRLRLLVDLVRGLARPAWWSLVMVAGIAAAGRLAAPGRAALRCGAAARAGPQQPGRRGSPATTSSATRRPARSTGPTCGASATTPSRTLVDAAAAEAAPARCRLAEDDADDDAWSA